MYENINNSPLKSVGYPKLRGVEIWRGGRNNVSRNFMAEGSRRLSVNTYFNRKFRTVSLDVHKGPTSLGRVTIYASGRRNVSHYNLNDHSL